MANPALRQRGQLMQVTLYDGTGHIVRGVIAQAETTTAEAGQAFADAGTLAWIDFDGDPNQIEFAEYEDVATGTRLHRRRIKAERIGSIFPVVKLNLSSEAVVLPARRADFSARDFSARDFNAG